MEQRIIPSCLPGLKPVLREQVIATRIDVQIYELLYDPPVATRDIEKGQGLKIILTLIGTASSLPDRVLLWPKRTHVPPPPQAGGPV